MRIRTFIAAAFGLISLSACSGDDEADKVEAAHRMAADTAASAPTDRGAMPPGEGTAPAPDYPAAGPSPDQTPPTLPNEPATTSPAASPPPQ